MEKVQKKYTAVLCTDDGNGTISKRDISWNQLKVLAAVVCVLVVITVISLIYGFAVTSTLKSENAQLTLQLGEVSREKSELAMENESLQEKVLLLSETVNQKVEAEADAIEKAIPAGFPLAGITNILEAEETDEQTQKSEPEVVFEAAKGNSVIAAGSGKIVSIVADEKWGKVLKIDHGNGYVSVYKVDASPKVKEGDELTKGTLLFEITDDKEKIGYQIIKEEVYINPMELMEISG